jgi:hypothetical protein
VSLAPLIGLMDDAAAWRWANTAFLVQLAWRMWKRNPFVDW